jgi:hypothetical protein
MAIVTIQTPSLVIRDVRTSDAEALYACMRCEDHWRDLPLDPLTPESVSASRHTLWSDPQAHRACLRELPADAEACGDDLLVSGTTRLRTIPHLLCIGQMDALTASLAGFGRTVSEVGAILLSAPTSPDTRHYNHSDRSRNKRGPSGSGVGAWRRAGVRSTVAFSPSHCTAVATPSFGRPHEASSTPYRRLAARNHFDAATCISGDYRAHVHHLGGEQWPARAHPAAVHARDRDRGACSCTGHRPSVDDRRTWRRRPCARARP